MSKPINKTCRDVLILWFPNLLTKRTCYSRRELHAFIIILLLSKNRCSL